MRRRTTLPPLNRAEIKVMLHHMGLVFEKQAPKITGLRQQLDQMRKEKPEQYQRAYAMVVRKEHVSSNIPAQPDRLSSTELEAAIRSEVKKQRVDHDAKMLDKTVAGLHDDMYNQIEELVKQEAKVLHRIEVKTSARKINKVDGVAPECFEDLIRLASQRVNILMVGPSGSGKTHTAGMVAQALGLKYGAISCSAGMSESQLTGWLLPTGDGGKFEYVASEFIKRYEQGGVFLFDEFDASDPNTVVFINQAIAGDHFFLPQRFNKPLIKRHKDFVCIAAANTWGTGADAQYVGRSQLDTATLDRFKTGTVFIDYSKTVEQSLVEGSVYEWAVSIRTQINTHGLRRVMSTRTMLDLSKMTRNEKWAKTEWEKSYFAGWTPDELRKIGYTGRPNEAA